MEGAFATLPVRELEEELSVEDIAMMAGGNKGAIGAGPPVIAEVSLLVAAGGEES